MIIALEEAKYKLIGMRADIDDLGSALRIDQLRATDEELDKETLKEDFWSNQENSSKVLQKLKQTKDTIENYEALKARLELLERNDEDNLKAINDLSEDMRQEIDNIYQAIAVLSVQRPAEPQNTVKKIGFK